MQYGGRVVDFVFKHSPLIIPRCSKDTTDSQVRWFGMTISQDGAGFLFDISSPATLDVDSLYG